jgi:hypothetical protein
MSSHDYYEYHESKESLMENRTHEDYLREKEEAEDKKFMEEVDKAYSILWEMWSPKSDMKREGTCEWDGDKENKLKKMLNCIDEQLGR